MASKQKSTTTTDMGPWKVQQPYLTDAFGKAQDLYNTTSATPGYQGDFYAGQTDTQKGIANNAVNYFNDTGHTMANEIQDASSGLAGQGAQGLSNNAAGLYGLAQGDSTGTNIANANRYANNPAIDSMVQAATYAGNRNAAENVIPNLYRSAAASGNLNSDRTALAQGVVERGLAENAQNIDANLRGSAYETGLGLSQADEAQRAQNYQNAGQLSDAMLARGAGGLTDAFNMQTQSLGNAADYAAMAQTENQNQLQNDFQKQQYNEQRPYQLLNNYYGLVGSNNWGSNGTSSTTSSSQPGAASIIGGALGAAGSLFGGMGPFGMAGAFPNALRMGGTVGSSSAASANPFAMGFANPFARA